MSDKPRREEQAPLDKRRVRHNFNTAAADYDRVAALQRLVGARLLERLEVMRVRPRLCLDLGSGTGFLARRLAARYRRCRIVQLDCAFNMLRQARRRGRRLFSRQRYLCADAERLPLKGAVVDLVVSNLMLQWSAAPARLLRECRRALRPGGLLLLSGFGPDTLTELRQSWREADDYTHVNTFADMHDTGDALMRAGFAAPVLESERCVALYPDARALLRELQALGATNSNAGRRRSLTGRGALRRMLAAYERRFPGPETPATFEIVYGHAWAPSRPPSAPTAGGDIIVPVAAVGGRKAHGGRHDG